MSNAAASPQSPTVSETLGWTRRELIVALALLIGFFCVYLLIAEAYRTMPGYSEHRNIFFGADHDDALRGWVNNHKGSHPLVLLVVVPIGQLLAAVTGSYEDGMVVYAASVGALTVSLFFLTLRAVVQSTFGAASVALFFGFSMSQLVFACIPDTYMLSAFLLLPSYLLAIWCSRRGEWALPAWTAVGVASFGVTLTNFMQTLVLFAMVLIKRPPGRRFRQCAKFLVAVGVVVVSVSLFQKAVYPEAKLFFELETFEHESQYTSRMYRRDPIKLGSELFKNFFAFPFIGPQPRATVFKPGKRLKLVYYKVKLEYAWLGTIAFALWMGLLVRGVYLSARAEDSRELTAAVALVVTGNLVLHAIYGPRELFLYTPHFTFAVLLLCQSRRSLHGTGVASLWLVLALLAAVNNLGVVWQMLDDYAA